MDNPADIFVMNPHLLAKWKVSSVRIDRSKTKLSFTVFRAHRVEIEETPRGFDVTVTWGMYKKKKSEMVARVPFDKVTRTIESLVEKFNEELRVERVEIDREKYRRRLERLLDHDS
jgi:hypothetical protein